MAGMSDQREWHCKNCGRRFSVEAEQTPRSCPFCGSAKLKPGAMGTIADYLAQKMAVESDPRRGRPL